VHSLLYVVAGCFYVECQESGSKDIAIGMWIKMDGKKD